MPSVASSNADLTTRRQPRPQSRFLLRTVFLLLLLGLWLWNLSISLNVDLGAYSSRSTMATTSYLLAPFFALSNESTFATLRASPWCTILSPYPCPAQDAWAYDKYRQAELDAGIQNIFYINLPKNVLRRENMEATLQAQNVTQPWKRVVGIKGLEPPEICIEGLRHPERCAGVQGILKSNLHIMRNENVTGGSLTLVMEDDFIIHNYTLLQESIKWIPDDWDVIRFETVDYEINPSFDYLPVPQQYEPALVFRANFIRPCNTSCNYCGGAFCMLWRSSSISKLYHTWSNTPASDLDCRLAWTPHIRSYVINMYGRIGAHAPPEKEVTDIPKYAPDA